VKRKRFSVEQIVAVPKQAEVGVPVAELIRQVGITEQTLYRWKKQYKGLETDQVRQFKQLQEENARLKRLVAELTLDKTMLQDVLAKNCDALAPPPGGGVPTRDLPGERAACVPCGTYKVSTFRYESMQEPRTALRLRIREIAQTRVRYGYRKIRVLLNREGWKVGKKLVYRLYREEGLTLRHTPRKRRRAVQHRRERLRPTGPNQAWSLDFVADQLADGRRFRALTILDVFTRESLAIEVGQRLRGADVVGTLNQIRAKRACLRCSSVTTGRSLPVR